MSTPNDFFTAESLATFSGAVAATFVVPNAIQKAFNWNPRWLALVLAWVICFGVVFSQKAAGISTPPITYVVAFFNGCLVFLSAAGGTALGSGATAAASLTPKSLPHANLVAEGAAQPAGSARRFFFSSWF